MKNITRSLVILAFLVATSVTAFSQVSDSKTEKVKTLMELTGSSKQYKQIMDVLISSIKKSSPNVPSTFVESLIKEMNIEDLKNQMVPIYEKYFTETDIDAMITFYQSETGKKTIDKMPMIMADYMPIVQERIKLVVEKMKKQQENSAVK